MTAANLQPTLVGRQQQTMDDLWLVIGLNRGVATEGTSITAKGELFYSSYLILGLE